MKTKSSTLRLAQAILASLLLTLGLVRVAAHVDPMFNDEVTSLTDAGTGNCVGACSFAD